jgi:hypothetical protein
MSRATGYETMRTRTGDVLQAGVKTRPAAAHHDLTSTYGWITRAVVTATYYADEDQRGHDPRSMSCDVRTYGRYTRELPKVPVLQRTHGLWDYDIYTPRAARQDIEGSDLIGTGSKGKRPTSAEKMDGDHVLIGFLDNDPNQPVILPFTLGHKNANYRPAAADGHVRRIRHNGVLMAWDKDGNFSIDATGGAAEILGPKGTEVASGGNVSVSGVTVKLLSDEVELGNGAGDAVVLGDAYQTQFNNFLTALSTWSGAVVGPPPPVAAAFSAAIALMKSGSYLSSKVKVG